MGEEGEDEITEATRTMGRTLSFPEKARSYRMLQAVECLTRSTVAMIWGTAVEAGRLAGRPLPRY